MTKKRFLSLFLVVVMLMSMMPAAGASSVEDGTGDIATDTVTVSFRTALDGTDALTKEVPLNSSWDLPGITEAESPICTWDDVENSSLGSRSSIAGWEVYYVENGQYISWGLYSLGQSLFCDRDCVIIPAAGAGQTVTLTFAPGTLSGELSGAPKGDAIVVELAAGSYISLFDPVAGGHFTAPDTAPDNAPVEFKCWNVNGVSYNYYDYYTVPDEDVTLTAEYYPCYYVTLVPNSEYNSEGMTEYKELKSSQYTYTLPGTMNDEGLKTGAVLYGWEDNKSKVTYPVGYDLTLTESVSFTAQYYMEGDETLTVNFAHSDPNCQIYNNSFTLPKGTGFPLPDFNGDLPNGMAFVGWTLTDGAGNVLEDSNLLEAGDYVATDSIAVDENGAYSITATAQFVQMYNVYFNGTNFDSIYVASGTQITLQEPLNEDQSRRFSHWSVAGDENAKEYKPGTAYTVTGNTTFEAVFIDLYAIDFALNIDSAIPDGRTLNFDLNLMGPDNAPITDPVSLSYGYVSQTLTPNESGQVSFSVPLDGGARNLDVHLGYFLPGTTVSGTASYNNAEGFGNGTFELNETLDDGVRVVGLYLDYCNEYTVTYSAGEMANVQGVGTLPGVTASSENALTLPPLNYVKEAYAPNSDPDAPIVVNEKYFIGWKIEGDESDTVYPCDYNFGSPTEDLSFTAVWVDKSEAKVNIHFIPGYYDDNNQGRVWLDEDDGDQFVQIDHGPYYIGQTVTWGPEGSGADITLPVRIYDGLPEGMEVIAFHMETYEDNDPSKETTTSMWMGFNVENTIESVELLGETWIYPQYSYEIDVDLFYPHVGSTETIVDHPSGALLYDLEDHRHKGEVTYEALGDGYFIHAGWFIDKDNDNVYDEGSDVLLWDFTNHINTGETGGNSYPYISASDLLGTKADRTITAWWAPGFEVTYADSITGESGDSTEYSRTFAYRDDAQGTITLLHPNDVLYEVSGWNRDGYVFKGYTPWVGGVQGDMELAAGEALDVSSNESVTLWANWMESDYALTLTDGLDGTVYTGTHNDTPVTVYADDESYTLTAGFDGDRPEDYSGYGYYWLIEPMQDGQPVDDSGYTLEIMSDDIYDLTNLRDSGYTEYRITLDLYDTTVEEGTEDLINRDGTVSLNVVLSYDNRGDQGDTGRFTLDIYDGFEGTTFTGTEGNAVTVWSDDGEHTFTALPSDQDEDGNSATADSYSVKWTVTALDEEGQALTDDSGNNITAVIENKTEITKDDITTALSDYSRYMISPMLYDPQSTDTTLPGLDYVYWASLDVTYSDQTRPVGGTGIMAIYKDDSGNETGRVLITGDYYTVKSTDNITFVSWVDGKQVTGTWDVYGDGFDNGYDNTSEIDPDNPLNGEDYIDLDSVELSDIIALDGDANTETWNFSDGKTNITLNINYYDHTAAITAADGAGAALPGDTPLKNTQTDVYFTAALTPEYSGESDWLWEIYHFDEEEVYDYVLVEEISSENLTDPFVLPVTALELEKGQWIIKAYALDKDSGERISSQAEYSFEYTYGYDAQIKSSVDLGTTEINTNTTGVTFTASLAEGQSYDGDINWVWSAVRSDLDKWDGEAHELTPAGDRTIAIETVIALDNYVSSWQLEVYAVDAASGKQISNTGTLNFNVAYAGAFKTKIDIAYQWWYGMDNKIDNPGFVDLFRGGYLGTPDGIEREFWPYWTFTPLNAEETALIDPVATTLQNWGDYEYISSDQFPESLNSTYPLETHKLWRVTLGIQYLENGEYKVYDPDNETDYMTSVVMDITDPLALWISAEYYEDIYSGYIGLSCDDGLYQNKSGTDTTTGVEYTTPYWTALPVDGNGNVVSDVPPVQLTPSSNNWDNVWDDDTWDEILRGGITGWDIHDEVVGSELENYNTWQIKLQIKDAAGNPCPDSTCQPTVIVTFDDWPVEEQPEDVYTIVVKDEATGKTYSSAAGSEGAYYIVYLPSSETNTLTLSAEMYRNGELLDEDEDVTISWAWVAGNATGETISQNQQGVMTTGTKHRFDDVLAKEDVTSLVIAPTGYYGGIGEEAEGITGLININFILTDNVAINYPTTWVDAGAFKIGDQVTLEVKAVNATEYQWYHQQHESNYTPIDGATQAIYSFRATLDNHGEYVCAVTGPQDGKIVTLNDPTAGVTGLNFFAVDTEATVVVPETVDIIDGQATLTMTSISPETENYTYRWIDENGDCISGNEALTSPEFAIENAVAGSQYSLVVFYMNALNVTSEPVTLVDPSAPEVEYRLAVTRKTGELVAELPESGGTITAADEAATSDTLSITLYSGDDTSGDNWTNVTWLVDDATPAEGLVSGNELNLAALMADGADSRLIVISATDPAGETHEFTVTIRKAGTDTPDPVISGVDFNVNGQRYANSAIVTVEPGTISVAAVGIGEANGYAITYKVNGVEPGEYLNEYGHLSIPVADGDEFTISATASNASAVMLMSMDNGDGTYTGTITLKGSSTSGGDEGSADGRAEVDPSDPDDPANPTSIDVKAILMDNPEVNEPVVYSVELVWGSMAFKYVTTTHGPDKVWDDTTHSWTTGDTPAPTTEWALVSDTKLTLDAAEDIFNGTAAENYALAYNHSNAPVNITMKTVALDGFNITPTLTQVSGGVAGTNSNGAVTYALEKGVEKDRYNASTSAGAYVELSGTPTTGSLNENAVPVAKLTITVSKAD